MDKRHCYKSDSLNALNSLLMDGFVQHLSSAAEQRKVSPVVMPLATEAVGMLESSALTSASGRNGLIGVKQIFFLIEISFA